MKAVPLARFAYPFAMALCLFSNPAVHAESAPYSDSLMGPLGLNTVPNARMDEPGTIKAGVSTLDPYIHGYLGFQLAAPLYVQLRQNAETSNFRDEADALHPGLDLKLRLLKESAYVPELSVGLSSAIGKRRMGGEYIVASKRYKSLDLSLGAGWGRFGSAGHFSNPLAFLGGDYAARRDLSSGEAHGPADWFTGNDIGLFGGLEYFTPIKGLSFKADISSDRYLAEKNASDFKAPAAWSVGLNYSPTDWAHLAIATQGADKVMGRISLSSPISAWPKPGLSPKPETPLKTHRTDGAHPSKIASSAAQDGLEMAHVSFDKNRASATLRIEPDVSTPAQIGAAMVHMANQSGTSIEQLEITPTYMGLSGPKLVLMRADIERAAIRHQGSSDEIWQNAQIEPQAKWQWRKPNRYKEFQAHQYQVDLTLENTISLSENDSGFLGRSAFILSAKLPRLHGWLDSGFGMRYNFAQNLAQLNDYRALSYLPVRSDVDLFAARPLAIDHAYLAWTHSFRSDLHVSLIGGYLEEMYGGVGGEVLYRPLKSRLALGAESWLALKRDPLAGLNAGFTGDHLVSGHLNLWYDLPYWDVTLKGKFGRYLAEDIGGTIGLEKTFPNGVKLESFITLTDQRDIDLYGDRTEAYHGLRLSVPLGGLPYVPNHTHFDLKATPLGRDSGQMIEKPLSLYELTEPFSYREITQNWADILPKQVFRTSTQKK